MSYKKGSNWNDKNEMRCLLIFKKLKKSNFPRGMQAELCWEMSSIPKIGLSEGTISAKVGNYKSVAGVNNPSNDSKNTKRIYDKFKKLSIPELEREINKCS